MAKRGPPKKFTADVKAHIVESLTLGLSLAEALLVVGFSRAAYRLECAADPEFCQGVKAAAHDGKRHHLARVRNAEERWQASAWFLERKYGAEYGNKLKVEQAGSVKVQVTIEHVTAARARAQEYLRERFGEAAAN